MNVWQLQEAKAKLSELVKMVLKQGPQGISIRGLFEVVLISRKDYERLLGKRPSFVEFMKKSPLREINMDLERNKSKTREINL